jgi:hypothetical protein
MHHFTWFSQQPNWDIEACLYLYIYELKSHNSNPGFLIPHLCLFLNTLWDSIKRKETDRQGKPSTVHRSQGLTDVFFLMELWVGKGVDSKSKIRETLP